MSYTKEQLAGMSDIDVDKAIAALIGYKVVWGSTDYSDRSGWVAEFNEDYHSREFLKSYCTDWSATGPLMVEYGISLIFEPDEDGNVVVVEHKPSGIWSDNPSPLRSVCEVILMMGES